MKKALPESLQHTIDAMLEAETQISYGKPEIYNAFVSPNANTTAVSASGRVMTGADAVREATVNVSKGNIGERNRFVEKIACDYVEGMCFFVIKSGVEIDKEDGTTDNLCWVITYVLKEIDGKWMLVHRQNTRSKP
ncbi:MAG TPA: hypothetical protein GXZ65_06390 [Clostridiales bacterium]|jgi:ketosteroid isomerase-like protein|nr:hypothetical protein [Clostridiales bacterium]